MSSRRNERWRILSLAPSATSILTALGATKLLVGVSRWCPAVAPVGQLPQLGDCWELEVEAVAALAPTLIIGSVPYRAETLAKLLEYPAPLLATNPRTLADIFREIRLLGALVGRPRRAAQLVQRMKRVLAETARRTRRWPRTRVYAEAWPHPRISSPPWVAELIECAGGELIVPAGQKVDDAAVAAGNPEVIILAWTATGKRAQRASALRNPAWQHTPAVQQRRVHVVSDELLNTPGPPLLEGLRQLVQLLHPERGHGHSAGHRSRT